jgi:hypothetical protein
MSVCVVSSSTCRQELNLVYSMLIDLNLFWREGVLRGGGGCSGEGGRLGGGGGVESLGNEGHFERDIS